MSITRVLFNIELSNLKPGSKVIFADGTEATAVLISDKEVTATADGTAEATYKTTSNYTNLMINGLFAKYYHNYLDKFELKSQFDFTEIPIREYTPYFDNIDVHMSGNDRLTLILKGGKPGHSVFWDTAVGLTDGEAVFDENGEARAVFTGQEPYTGTVEISTVAMGKKQGLTITYDNWFPEFEDFENTHTAYGPMAKNIMDYRTEQIISLTGLMPEKEVLLTVSDERVKLSAESVTASLEGTATFSILPIDDFSVSDFTITAEYYENSAVKKTIDKEVKLYQ